MRKLAMLGLVGLVAQLIDGSLGMADGGTSTTLLLTAGIAPAISIFLFCLGAYILVRFARKPRERRARRRLPAVFLSPLGAFAGFMDAAGGGGWGPIGTPTLLSSGRLEPRKVVGSVDTGEFLVAVGASAGFLVALPLGDLDLAIVGALLAGGLIAAPIAAWLVRNLPARILGTAVGGMIVLTNARSFATAIEIPADARAVMYVSLAALAVAALWAAVVSHRRPVT